MSRRTRRHFAVRLVYTVLLLALALPLLGVLMFRFVSPPVTPYMLVRALTSRSGLDYRWVPGRTMSTYLVRAVVAAEDARFMHHHGFDWAEMQLAWRAGRRGQRLRGASTISMQSARLLFLWPGRSVVRKAAEACLTVLLEALWPKARILETYLNLVEWGDGVYGCEAAAQRTFATSCAQLDAEQAARLAAILPNPHRWSARSPGPYVSRRVAIILRRMAQVTVPRVW